MSGTGLQIGDSRKVMILHVHCYRRLTGTTNREKIAIIDISTHCTILHLASDGRAKGGESSFTTMPREPRSDSIGHLKV